MSHYFNDIHASGSITALESIESSGTFKAHGTADLYGNLNVDGTS